MGKRFSYVRYDAISMERQETFRNMFETIETFADKILPESRPKSLFFTFLEIAYMWTGKAIRDEQIERQGKIDEQPERNNE